MLLAHRCPDLTGFDVAPLVISLLEVPRLCPTLLSHGLPKN